jgi:hypothetical protein
MTRFVDLARRALRTAAVGASVAIPAVLVAQGSPVGGAALQATAGRPYAAPAASAGSRANAGAPASIAIEGGARRMLVGATVPHVARVRDASGAERRDVSVQWTSSNPNVASVNQFGVMTAARPGPVIVRVVAGSLSAERKYTVEANTVRSLTLSITADQAKTGDVVEVAATAFDGNGMKVPNVPFLYTFTAAVEDSAVGQLAPAELDQKGRFVAQKAGDYQIIAVAPGLVAHRTVRVSNRAMVESARLVARTSLPAVQTSDLVAWRASDGRDYVMACGSGARGQVVSYEMTDAALNALDTVSVDAKSVADCVIDSETGVAAIVRDGPNNRGAISLFDASDPRALKPLGSLTEGVGAMGGVSIYKRHVFVVSDARRLDVVSIEDPSRPRRVGSIELGDAGGASGSDVWVSDGIAYVALGRSGMAIVDVGNGKFGGSAAKPARIGAFHTPFASTHAAYGFRSRTGKWYVVTSEDLTPGTEGRSAVAASASASASQPGFARIIDFTDPTRPEEVARYEVPEAGVQDLWVDAERLYVAAQNGGLRVVDISADLKGNLYHQGREIARFVPGDERSAAPNVVAVQPHRGLVLVADRNTGVWVVRLGSRD